MYACLYECTCVYVHHFHSFYDIQGILEAYHYSLSQVQLFGPTNFSYFLDKAIQYASDSSMSQAEQNYTILLVITVRGFSISSYTYIVLTLIFLLIN